MTRSQITIIGASLGVVVVLLGAIFFFPKIKPEKQMALIPASQTITSGSPENPIVGANAFVSQIQGPSGEPAVSGSSSVSVSPLFQGKPVASLGAVAQIIASATLPSSRPSGTVTGLPIPTVADSEIAIDPSGVATMMGYLSYFADNYTQVEFSGAEFSGSLTDKNGVILPITGLVDKAIVDNNFKEISASLLIQEKFIAAEINFLKSIKVTGDAITLDKETIGTEELTSDLASQALAVASGTLSQSSFIDYYDQFNDTMSVSHRNLVAQSGILSLGTVNNNGIAGDIFQFLGLSTPAVAQVVTAPFGGLVTAVLPCDCDLGEWVIVGPPSPASLFVPYLFLSSPLFFPDYVDLEGAWWLGLYLPAPLVPCLSETAECGPIGAGGGIMMVGTSE